MSLAHSVSTRARLRSTLLGSAARTVLAVLTAGSAFVSPALAQVPGIAPSIEIHADVIESLRQSYQAAPAPAVAQPAPKVEAPVRQPVNAPVARRAEAPTPPPTAVVAPAPIQEPAVTRWGMPASVSMSPPPGQAAVTSEAPVVVAPRARAERTRTETVRPVEVAPRVVEPAAPVLSPQEQASQRWSNRFPQPASRPTPPAVAAPIAPPHAVTPVAPLPAPVAVERPAPVLPPIAAPEPVKPPKPIALPPLPKAQKSIEALPAPIALPPVDAPAKVEKLPPLEVLPEPAKPAPAKPEPVNAAPKAPALPPVQKLPPIEELPPLPAPTKTPAPAALPIPSLPEPKLPAVDAAKQESSNALQAPASATPAANGEGYGLMDDIKRLSRKMLGKEAEPLKPITTPIPVPVLPEPKALKAEPLPPLDVKPIAPDAGMDLPPIAPIPLEPTKPAKVIEPATAKLAPIALPPLSATEAKETAAQKKAKEQEKKKAEAQEKKEQAAAEKAAKDAEKKAKDLAKKEQAAAAKAAKKAAAEKPAKSSALDDEMAPLTLPPLPGEPVVAPPADMPAELEPMPPLPPEPAPKKVEAPVKLEPVKEAAPEPKEEPAKPAKVDPLAGLPPISMLDDDHKPSKAVPVMPVTSSSNDKPMPPLPPLDRKEAPVKKDAAKKEIIAPKGEVRTVKATPVTEVGGAELPPILDLPPLPSEAAKAPEAVLAPIKGPAPKPSDALELLEKNGTKLAPVTELASLPTELPPLPALPEESAVAEKAPAKAEAPKADAISGSAVRVLFKKDALDIPGGSDDALKRFAKETVANPGKRVVIASFASGKGDEQARAARKIALSRGLKVRSFLIDQGVDALRINVTSKMDDGAMNPDRVEVGLQ